MSEQDSPLDRLAVASPCSASWERMRGDDRVRFCDLCGLNVYNLTSMDAADVERLLLSKEGRLCGRLYRKRDGTVLASDCPVGVRALRRAKALGAALIGLLALAFGYSSWYWTRQLARETMIGEIVPAEFR